MGAGVLPRIQSNTWALAAGVTVTLVGIYLLHDALEGRGVRRPVLLRLLPG